MESQGDGGEVPQEDGMRCTRVRPEQEASLSPRREERKEQAEGRGGRRMERECGEGRGEGEKKGLGEKGDTNGGVGWGNRIGKGRHPIR